MESKIVPLYLPLFNYFTPLYLLAGGVLLFAVDWSTGARVILIIGWVYLVPPLLCRILLAVLGRPQGVLTPEDHQFVLWWFLTQLQVVYNRLPFVEELLRLMPGLYSLWLNLWGAKASVMVFWSPGVTVADRYLLNVGSGVVLGSGCRVGGHVLQRDKSGELRLTVSPVTIDDGAIVGLHAGVGPGCHVHAYETIPAGRLIKPFVTWKEGRAHRPEAPGP